jgi:hypothetical protein
MTNLLVDVVLDRPPRLGQPDATAASALGGGRRLSASKFHRPPAGSSPSISTSSRRRAMR